MDTEAPVAHTGLELVKKSERAVGGDRVDVKIHNIREHVSKCGEFVEVCCEQAEAFDLCCNVLGDGPRESKSIICGGSPPQLVDDDERVLSGTLFVCE